MKTIWLNCFLILLSVPNGFGQGILSLESALEIGLSNNYGINIAKNNYQVTENNVSPGNAGMLPRIDAGAGYGYSLTNAKVENTSGLELTNSSANSGLITAGINLRWTLFDGLNMFITYDKLKKLEEIGELDSRIAVENTTARIIGSYYDIVKQAKVSAIMQEQVEISKFRLELAKLSYETGSGSELEYLKARVELNADIAGLSSQETVFQNSMATLNDLLSRDVTTVFEVRDTILVNYLLNYDSLRQSMRISNRKLLLYNRNKEISGLNIRSARAVQWPSLGVVTGFNYFQSETEANFINYNRNFGPVIGLSASMNIFNGMNMHRDYQNAKISLSSSELEVKQLENRLDAYLLKIYNEYRNELQLISFEKENLVLAQKSMDIAKESFAVGSISSLQLREIQKNLLDAGTRLITAEFNTKLTETELLLISGQLVH